ncbi:SMI1/KNR4 family protein [Pedobacter cryoconitis]|uniref:Cell wall assembly regulator SMI1 n=1 Tax=Pedobacter cryoconitis TaxID=188932 RepID=A0A7X0J6T1_9SPHI|nr:SMI1/KNR4 family protein [Pedobacter cryoconitis]MBB6502150.1 cell wall assembly regulator SMI1 [Pedobacter cryoconitis]
MIESLLLCSMQNSWTEIKNQLEKISSTVADSFNKPAGDEEIALLEMHLKQSLPGFFKEYLKTFNGQLHNEFKLPFVGYNCLLSIAEIIDIYKRLLDLFGDEPKIDWVQENKVQPVIWDKSWIPFTASETNTKIALDLNPGINGVYGQVIQLWPGQDLEGDHIVIASSFEEFSEKILSYLKEKKYKLEEGKMTFTDNWII